MSQIIIGNVLSDASKKESANSTLLDSWKMRFALFFKYGVLQKRAD